MNVSRNLLRLVSMDVATGSKCLASATRHSGPDGPSVRSAASMAMPSYQPSRYPPPESPKAPKQRNVFKGRSKIPHHSTKTVFGRWSQFMGRMISYYQEDPTVDHYPRSINIDRFSWGDFNKLGDLNLCCHVDNLQMAAYQFIPDISCDHEAPSMLTRSMTIDFLPAYHATDFVGRSARYDCRFGHLGKTSFHQTVDLRDGTSDDVYMSAMMEMILLDPHSNRPCDLPMELHEKYAHRTALWGKPDGLAFEALPQDHVFAWSKRIESSDVDHSDHMTQSAFLRLALDAASYGASRGYLPSFDREVIHYKLLNYSVEHLQPVKVGDNVEFVCWESERDAGTLNYEVLSNGELMSRSRAVFFNRSAWKQRILSSNNGQVLTP